MLLLRYPISDNIQNREKEKSARSANILAYFECVCSVLWLIFSVPLHHAHFKYCEQQSSLILFFLFRVILSTQIAAVLISNLRFAYVRIVHFIALFVTFHRLVRSNIQFIISSLFKIESNEFNYILH